MLDVNEPTHRPVFLMLVLSQASTRTSCQPSERATVLIVKGCPKVLVACCTPSMSSVTPAIEAPGSVVVTVGVNTTLPLTVPEGMLPVTTGSVAQGRDMGSP